LQNGIKKGSAVATLPYCVYFFKPMSLKSILKAINPGTKYSGLGLHFLYCGAYFYFRPLFFFVAPLQL
jgi:hypothetical protein